MDTIEIAGRKIPLRLEALLVSIIGKTEGKEGNPAQRGPVAAGKGKDRQ